MREEGAALAQEAAVATLAYLLNGIDLGVRAEAVRAEQATVTDVAAPTEVQPQGFLLSGSPQLDPQVAAILNAPSGQGFVLDQMIGPDGQVRTGSGGIDFRALAQLTAGGGAGGVAHFPDLPKSPFLAGRNESYNPATNTIDFDLDKFYENKAIDEKAIERSLERE